MSEEAFMLDPKLLGDRKATKKPTIERRLDQLERALKHFSEGVWRVSDEIAVLRNGKHNPEREKLEKRVRDLENKFFAFQCGAQAQMERDREAWKNEQQENEQQENERKRAKASREALRARETT